jgi:hypothetical protein
VGDDGDIANAWVQIENSSGYDWGLVVLIFSVVSDGLVGYPPLFPSL